ncbi:Uncharacterized conserved protein YutE, UPF0331/DUF86 family [Desulfonispora thiosulfatigenes DSM 11270]|uniref:Uncharacterized conserved protein YutE, UPF0331/DUF86 family n=1 Tax=Desulfonispora thiosulfatigenes DSM 11270 TaxID=656914 RepID=A0A1W1VCP2_DESTI|nr:DUF86 domain-containing protein [Desulfonispora thiosulfatigenes]SMB91076.1 Uncharacterized conserved protein YutE, UPF0331/DUF86 family [Desulfonispora thiosulfatigenes DSM 11270]
MESDVILNKIQTIERCLKRIAEEYDNNSENLKNYTKQDSIILNIQRACEASLDIGMHIIAEKKLGIPQTSRDVFEILQENKIIAKNIADNLKAMVGFRNVAVHDYQKLNLKVVQKIIENHLTDFQEYTKQIILKEF